MLRTMSVWCVWLCVVGCAPEEPIDTGTYDPAADPDGDGLTNQEEEDLGLDNHNPDTDGDGFTDGQEVNGNTDAADPEDYPYAGGWDIGACRDSIQPTGKNVGDIAVDFGLMDQFGEEVTLHSFCDRVVLVVSMQTNPYQEMDDIVDDEYLHLWQDYERVGLMVLSLLGPEEKVEPTSESASEWADKQGLTHPVLSDVGWAVTQTFTGGADPSVPSYSLFDRGVKIAQLDRALDVNYVLALLD